jgi:hypothetical protein
MAIYDFNTSVHIAKREGIEIGEKRGRQAIHLGDIAQIWKLRFS